MVDNLSAHKGARVKEIVEGRGCELVYLPPYSPDLNPIEQAFSRRSRGFMRKAEARTREALMEAMGRALDALTSRDARGFFGHCAVTARWTNYYDKRSSFRCAKKRPLAPTPRSYPGQCF